MTRSETRLDGSTAWSVCLQGKPVYYALVKCANTLCYFALLLLTWRFLAHNLDWQLSTGCLVLSTGWLSMTRLKLDQLLLTYFDVLSRIEMQLPMVLGIALSTAAIVVPNHWAPKLVAAGEIACWVYIFIKYKRNQARFIKQGHGPVPKATVINPPEQSLRPGDLILTSGNVACELHESVGHAEMFLLAPDGTALAFSSYMARGAIIQPFHDAASRTKRGHYIALHLRQPWTPEEAQAAYQIAKTMVAANTSWAQRENEKIERLLKLLPIARSWRQALIRRLHVSGYDWFGTFMGRLAEDRWTCIGACIELYHRMAVKTNYYGTGLLGFGTTLFDPILPVRFLADPAFVLIKQPDQPDRLEEVRSGLTPQKPQAN